MAAVQQEAGRSKHTLAVLPMCLAGWHWVEGEGAGRITGEHSGALTPQEEHTPPRCGEPCQQRRRERGERDKAFVDQVGRLP